MVLWLHFNILMSLLKCRTSQYGRTFIHLIGSLWNHLADHVFDSVGLAGSNTRANNFYLPKLLIPFLSSTVFPFLFFLLIKLELWGIMSMD